MTTGGTASIWTQTETGYVTEASTLAGVAVRPFKCPCGKTTWSDSDLTEHRTGDEDNEITDWTTQVTCCGKLTIFND